MNTAILFVGGGGGGLLFMLLIMGLFLFLFMRGANRAMQLSDPQRELSRPPVDPEQLAAVRRAIAEDVTVFGEELQRLGDDTAGTALDTGTRADYQRALDDYEAAKESAEAITDPEQVRQVAEILEDGRYAMECVRARIAGQPLPQRRPPCFFNPRHGTSVRDVAWTPSGGAPRDVPACALDAERVEAGADPDSRKVMVSGQRVPYWDAGPAFAPFAAGYFAFSGILPMMMMGTMMGSMFAADGSYSEGYQDGVSDGGGDYSGDGGGDYSGGDYSGGDYSGGGGYSGGDGFGGGDFGGFDGF